MLGYAASLAPVVALAGFFATHLLVPLWIHIARKLEITDHPGERRLNTRVIPRGGGVTVFLGFHFAAAVEFDLLGVMAQGLNREWWHAHLCASAVLLVVGLLDDKWNLKPFVKLLGQTTAAVAMFYLDIRVGNILGTKLPFALNFLATVLWFLTITNAFNLIDGLDGLATGLALIASIGLGGALIFRGRYTDALAVACLVGPSAAFLRFNFHPARVFLGDTGSMFLGFTLASIALGSSTKGTVLASLGVPLMALGVPLFDTLLAVWRRSVRRMLHPSSSAEGVSEMPVGIMSSDMDHLHHRMMRRGLTQRRVAILLYIANAALVLLGLTSLALGSSAGGLFIISLTLGSYIVVRHIAHVELWDSGEVLIQGLRRPSRRVAAVLLYPLIDVCLLLFSFATTAKLLSPMFGRSFSKWLFLTSVWCGVTFILLILSGTYKRVWSKARTTEFLAVSATVGGAVALCWGLSKLNLWFDSAGLPLASAILFGLLSAASLVGVRLLPRAARDIMSLYRSASRDTELPRVAVYGTDEAGLSCIHEKTDPVTRAYERQIVVGLYDEDVNLRNRFVHGHRVVGGIQELMRTISRGELDEVFITLDLDPEVSAHLVEAAKQSGTQVRSWKVRDDIWWEGNAAVRRKAATEPLVQPVQAKTSPSAS